MLRSIFARSVCSWWYTSLVVYICSSKTSCFALRIESLLLGGRLVQVEESHAHRANFARVKNCCGIIFRSWHHGLGYLSSTTTYGWKCIRIRDMAVVQVFWLQWYFICHGSQLSLKNFTKLVFLFFRWNLIKIKRGRCLIAAVDTWWVTCNPVINDYDLFGRLFYHRRWVWWRLSFPYDIINVAI